MPHRQLAVQVRAILRAGRLQDLVAADELTCMRKAGRAFQGWQEGPLSFPPTFKFRRGTSHYIGTPPLPTSSVGQAWRVGGDLATAAHGHSCPGAAVL